MIDLHRRISILCFVQIDSFLPVLSDESDEGEMGGGESVEVVEANSTRLAIEELDTGEFNAKRVEKSVSTRVTVLLGSDSEDRRLVVGVGRRRGASVDPIGELDASIRVLRGDGAREGVGEDPSAMQG